jgi:predicted nucleotidyltransferase component of viral defense system
MMATKTRALYQRSKGRDLFDLWLVLTYEDASPEEIVAGLRHYMNDSVFTYPS